VWIKKASNLISKEGMPGPYVSILIQLEDFLKQTNADKEVHSAALHFNNYFLICSGHDGTSHRPRAAGTLVLM
jgi:hypothetical protein